MHHTHSLLPPQRLGLPILNVAISILKTSRQAKGKYLCLISDYLYSYFREVSKLVFQHAAAIPRERVSLFFRHAVLHLYGYLQFKPLWFLIHHKIYMVKVGVIVIVWILLNCLSKIVQNIFPITMREVISIRVGQYSRLKPRILCFELLDLSF